jgi:chemotaxis protein MotA
MVDTMGADPSIRSPTLGPERSRNGLARGCSGGVSPAQASVSRNDDVDQGSGRLNIVFGMALTIASLVGGFVALGGNIAVIWQPWEFVIIAGAATGTFIVANPWRVVGDTGVAVMEALTNAVPKQRNYLDLLGLLYALMREMRSKPRNEVETHIDNPGESQIFKAFPSILNNTALTQFICDYFRLHLVGNARTHEIE